MGSTKDQQRKYLQQVLEAHRTSGKGARALSRIFPVPFTTIHHWITNFAEEKDPKVMGKRNKAKRVTGQRAPENMPTGCQAVFSGETDSERISRLERELTEARIERDLYKEMINVAEKRFDIQIRKKAGTRQ